MTGRVCELFCSASVGNQQGVSTQGVGNAAFEADVRVKAGEFDADVVGAARAVVMAYWLSICKACKR